MSLENGEQPVRGASVQAYPLRKFLQSWLSLMGRKSIEYLKNAFQHLNAVNLPELIIHYHGISHLEMSNYDSAKL